jgi:hypothetical protein
LPASNYGKKGTKYDFNWGRCEDEACEAVHFEKIAVGKNTKPKQFALYWDNDLRLTEKAY